MFEEPLDLVGGAIGVAPFHAFIGQTFEPFCRRLMCGDLAGVFVAQLAKVEVTVLDQLRGAIHRAGVGPEQTAHVGL